MLRTSAVFVALAFAACTNANTDDNATLVFGSDVESGYFEVQLQRGDPSHTFGALSATIDGVAFGAPTVTPGGCDTNDPDPLGGGCSPAIATFEISPDVLGGAGQADVSVVEGDESFHFVSPDFFTPRSIVLQSPGQMLVAGATVAVSDGAASDQIGGWFDVWTANKRCYALDSTGEGTGTTSFNLDAADYDPTCDAVPAGTVVSAEVDITLQAVEAQTCAGPESLICSQGAPWLDQTVTMQLQL